MLLLYEIGHCAMSLIAGTSVGFVNGIIKTKKMVKIGIIIKIFFGILLVIFSIYFFIVRLLNKLIIAKLY